MNLKEIEDFLRESLVVIGRRGKTIWPDWVFHMQTLISRVKELEGTNVLGITYQGIYLSEAQAVMLISETQKENTKLSAELQEAQMVAKSTAKVIIKNEKLEAALKIADMMIGASIHYHDTYGQMEGEERYRADLENCQQKIKETLKIK